MIFSLLSLHDYSFACRPTNTPLRHIALSTRLLHRRCPSRPCLFFVLLFDVLLCLCSFVLSLTMICRHAKCPFSDRRITSRARRTEQTRRRTCCTLYSPSLMRRINTTYRSWLHRRLHRHCRRSSYDCSRDDESDRPSLHELIG
jgi:hypothetical protein